MARRVRFSLLGLLMVTLVVALAASNVVTFRRQHAAEAALESIRNDFGELTVRDDGQVHVIAIPSYEAMTYRWRVYLPPGRRYGLHVVAGNAIPESGLINGGSRDTLLSEFFEPQAGGRQLVQTVAINQSPQGKWRLTLDGGDGGSTIILPEPLWPWLDDSMQHAWSVIGKGKTAAARDGEPVVLLRLRKSKTLPGGAKTVEMQPTDGVLVWIEEARQDAR